MSHLMSPAQDPAQQAKQDKYGATQRSQDTHQAQRHHKQCFVPLTLTWCLHSLAETAVVIHASAPGEDLEGPDGSASRGAKHAAHKCIDSEASGTDDRQADNQTDDQQNQSNQQQACGFEHLSTSGANAVSEWVSVVVWAHSGHRLLFCSAFSVMLGPGLPAQVVGERLKLQGVICSSRRRTSLPAG